MVPTVPALFWFIRSRASFLLSKPLSCTRAYGLRSNSLPRVFIEAVPMRAVCSSPWPHIFFSENAKSCLTRKLRQPLVYVHEHQRTVVNHEAARSARFCPSVAFPKRQDAINSGDSAAFRFRQPNRGGQPLKGSREERIREADAGGPTSC